MSIALCCLCRLFFFNVTATTEIYTYSHTLSLHDALPISSFYDKSRQVFIVFNFSKYDEDICKSPVGDPHFLAIQQPVFAIFGRTGGLCLSGAGIRAGIRFGPAAAGQVLAGG